MDSLLNLHNILNIVGTLLNCLTDAVPRSTCMILVLGPYIYETIIRNTLYLEFRISTKNWIRRNLYLFTTKDHALSHSIFTYVNSAV